MYSKINYTLVGLFVFFFTAAMIAFGFWLAKYGFEQKYDRYLLYFDAPVDGLVPDAAVKLHGVPVGKVAEIGIDPSNVQRTRVLIRLKEGTPVTRGMYATLKMQGITGLSYVELEGGKYKAPLLKATGSALPVIPTRPSLLQRLSQDAPRLLKKIQKASDSLTQILSERNARHLSEILDNTAKASRKALEVEDRIVTLSDELHGTLRHFDKKTDLLSRQIGNITRTVNEKLPPLMDHLDTASANVASLARGLDQRMKRGEYDLRKMI
ncbi:MlaD family protein, partial [Nitratifractor sp.]|uniref:MlaD family protein n=1 Tax=Nitratifractor sp. TaxID=2268144 RepID=UPI0025D99790